MGSRIQHCCQALSKLAWSKQGNVIKRFPYINLWTIGTPRTRSVLTYVCNLNIFCKRPLLCFIKITWDVINKKNPYLNLCTLRTLGWGQLCPQRLNLYFFCIWPLGNTKYQSFRPSSLREEEFQRFSLLCF